MMQHDLPEQVILQDFSQAFSKKILDLSQENIKNAIQALYDSSITQRNSYYHQTAEDNFGVQMLNWLGLGEDKTNPNISAWLTAQKEEAVIRLLATIGITNQSPHVQTEREEVMVTQVFTIINYCLQQVQKKTLARETLSDTSQQLLRFYVRYLVNKDGIEQLFFDLAGAAMGITSSRDEAILLLQKISPLFAIVGYHTQFAFAGFIKALVDRSKISASVFTAIKAGVQTASDRKAWEVMGQYLKDDIPFQEEERGASISLENKIAIIDLFDQIQPNAVQARNPYWVAAGIPEDLAGKITPENVQVFETIRSLYDQSNDQHSPVMNSEVFAPVVILGQHDRFQKVKERTDSDANILALAAASTDTPERQAKLYNALVQVILEVHTIDRNLFERFLGNQNMATLEVFAMNDFRRTLPLMDSMKIPEVVKIKQEMQQEFQKDFNFQSPLSLAPEELIRLLQLWDSSIDNSVLSHIEDYPERLVAVRMEKSRQDFSMPTVDREKTIEGWQGRRENLLTVMKKEPLLLTLEQIRQIEFLGHSVNIPEVIQMIGGKYPPVPARQLLRRHYEMQH